MDDDSSPDGMEIFLARLMERLKPELLEDIDEGRALRRALIGLTIATADSERRAVRRFATFLLEDFEPVASHFQDETHALLERFDVRRHREDDRATLLFPSGLPEAIMEEPLSTDDLLLAGLKWPWERTAERYVAFFDIMGFKALVESSPPDRIHEVMNILRDAAVSGEQAGYDTRMPEGPLNFPGCWLRFVQFSDSIVLLTRDGSMQSSAIMTLAAQLMFAQAIGIGVPIRGAIAKGSFTADFERAIYFGQPLIDAYLLEGRQAWYGACYHESALDGGADPQTGEPAEGSGEPPKGWLPMMGRYLVPVKDPPGYEEMSAVNWALLFHGNPAALDKALEPMRNDDDPKLRKYFEETRRFGHAMLTEMESA